MCVKCKSLREKDDYYFGRDGRRSGYCRHCQRTVAKLRYEKQKENIVIRVQGWMK